MAQRGRSLSLDRRGGDGSQCGGEGCTLELIIGKARQERTSGKSELGVFDGCRRLVVSTEISHQNTRKPCICIAIKASL
jgi:hypothetical protein